MNRIKQLPIHEAQKIAAGEVVERPANIVKELIENAIDAQATSIEIHIDQAGHERIAIIDNGSGMSADDAPIAFLHHATSKINSVTDLQTLTTFGFRGEALSSIASVSNIRLITKTHDTLEGTELILHHANIVSQQPINAVTGTHIEITQLFDNVPARKKFLKSKETEWRAIVQIVNAFCIAYPHIHFKLIHDGRTSINCPQAEHLQARLTQLLDDDIVRNSIPLVIEHDHFTLEGFISNHHYFKYDRNHIYFLVNSRWVKNIGLSKSLLKGYQNVLPEGRFPCAYMHITVAPETIDVNIHPRKEEIQFIHTTAIERTIAQHVKLAIEQHLSAQLQKQVSFAPTPPRNFSTFNSSASVQLPPAPFAQPTSFANPSPAPFNNFPSRSLEPKPVAVFHSAPQTKLDELYNEESNQTQVAVDEQPLILGQLHKTYILLEHSQGLYVVDQHAAHERILYEQFKNRFEQLPTVPLLFPHIVSIAQSDIDLLEQHFDLFANNGIALEQNGPGQLMIQSLPVHLKEINPQELIVDMLSMLHNAHNVQPQELKKSLNEHLHAQMACKAAVKAGDVLTTTQMHQLINDLQKTNNRFSCPHGRPTGWLLSQIDIEKKFKRRT